MQGRGVLIALSIIIGIVLACAILPLGAFAVLLAAAGSGGSSGPLPAYSWQEEIVSGSGLDRVAIIEVNGVIGGASDPLSSQLSHDELLSQIRQATNDPLVKAVVLRIDSPGGGVVASNELHTALKQLRAADKRLVVSMGATAASGGYYIATAAERIYANPDTFTGSLGVILSLTNIEGAFEKLGLRTLVYKSGELKDIGSATRPSTPAEDAILQELVDEAYQGFVDVIVEGRQLPRERVEEIADGRIYTGRQALDLQLVDALGNLDDAIASAQELAGLENALVIRYRSGATLRSLLLSNLEQGLRPADPLGLQNITQPHPPRLEYMMMP